jgi:hypothetical protein
MLLKKYSLVIILLILSYNSIAQYDAPLYAAYTTTAEKAKLYERLVKYTINQNLATPLTDSTEENWEDAFGAIEVLLYNSTTTGQKVRSAFEQVENRSISFQRALLELAYTIFPGKFLPEVKALLYITTDTKVFAMSAEYLLQTTDKGIGQAELRTLTDTKFPGLSSTDPLLYMLSVRIALPSHAENILSPRLAQELFTCNFLPGQTVMYSIQRRDRDYPGMVLVRDKNGHFITDSSGNIFNVPQLARSITNLPGYLTNGNTPQGIFLMHGFDVSMSNFIGPTANVQLSMPVETNIRSFLGDSSITDTSWTLDYYKRLLPASLQNYLPLYYAYYAGAAGRTEIISHGTTIDPGFYTGKPYYPLTPTQGCLCTKEIWNGKRLESDQQKLVNALLKAGGANGYCVVIEIDDKQTAVTLDDIRAFVKMENEK